MIESGLVKQGLVKVGLVSALQNWAARYFRRNKGGDDYATIPAVTLAGDFVIEFDFLGSDAQSSMITGSSLTTNNFILVGSDGRFRVKDNGSVETGTPISSIQFNVFNRLKVVKTGSQVKLYINGVDSATGVSNSSFIFDLLYKYQIGLNANGILANLKIWGSGTPIHNYPLNEPKGTSVIYDIVGGNNGAIINSDDEDKGLFTKQADGDWKGSNLDVPPWDSVDQTLPVV